MKTNRDNISKEELAKAGEIIRAGGLVAFPTETVYGLGGNALNAEASAKIYAAKGRPSDNPLIVHIANISELEPLVREVPPVADKLMKRYWPGPMTLIFKKKDIIPDTTTGGLDTVAVRMPSHPVARAFIEAAGVPIAAPSANSSGRPSPTTAAHVLEDMDGKIEMIIDGGSADIGLESTIIDVTGEEPELLRPGYISIEDIRKLTGSGKIDPAVMAKPQEGLRPRAPGMKYRHYAPRAPLSIIEGKQEAVIKKINALSSQSQREGKKVGIICSKEAEGSLQADLVITAGSHRHDEEVAHNLFDILRKMDTEGVDIIYSESFSGGEMGMAIMNRMLKAAGYSIIKA